QSEKKDAKESRIRSLGGHCNGGKFCMRKMFKTSRAITYRDGKLNIFGFNAKGEYGFEEGFEDRKMSLGAAMKQAGVDNLMLPPEVKKGLEGGQNGFTGVLGDHPERVKGTA